MQVVKHHQHRSPRRRGREQLGGCFQQQHAFHVRVSHPRIVAARVGDQSPQRGALRGGQPGHKRRIAVADQRLEYLDPRLIRDAEILIGVAEQDDHALTMGSARELRDERGLPDAGLACDKHNLGTPGRVGTFAGLMQRFEFRRTSDKPEQRIGRRAHQTARQRHRPRSRCRFPHHLDRRYRLRQTLQHQPAERDERLARVPADRQAHEF